MSSGSTEISDKVTVLVFKDNYAARTFQIPLKWISRLGLALSMLATLLILCAFLAIRYYRISVRLDPTRVQELEQELTDLKINLKNLENRAIDTPLAHAIPAAQVSVKSSTSAPLTPTQQNEIPLFSGFPADIKIQTPEPESIPIQLQATRVQWRGKNLMVRFALQYVRDDQKNQEGKILIVARGTDSLLTYPSGTLKPTGSDFLISPEKGESFSVSRYREVKADFGPVKTLDSIQEVEIFVFNPENQILIYQRIKPEKNRPAERESKKNLDTTEAASPATTPADATAEPESSNL
jgi:hypothetical protein